VNGLLGLSTPDFSRIYPLHRQGAFFVIKAKDKVTTAMTDS